jgi:hypothetical protein
MEANVSKRYPPSATISGAQPKPPNPQPPRRKSSDAYFPVKEKRSVPTRFPRTTQSPTHRDPIDVVKADLAEVAEAWSKYRSTHSRDAVYPLLDRIFGIGKRWKVEKRVSEYSRLAVELKQAPVRMYAEAFGIILFAACDIDAKVRSTWSRVLRVAEANTATSIQAFVKEQGGRYQPGCGDVLGNCRARKIGTDRWEPKTGDAKKFAELTFGGNDDHDVEHLEVRKICRQDAAADNPFGSRLVLLDVAKILRAARRGGARLGAQGHGHQKSGPKSKNMGGRIRVRRERAISWFLVRQP